MKVIGVTGGVGSGKSAVLALLKEICSCEILMADDIANFLKQPGQPCFEPVVTLLGERILNENGVIDNRKMAAEIFQNPDLLNKVNAVIHPAVREYIIKKIRAEREKGAVDFLFLEAALLIECGYQSLVDEMWYVYADEQTRIRRLSDSRGYSEEKARGIIASQLTEEEYRAHCDWVLDNSKSMGQTKTQLMKRLNAMARGTYEI
ncbi:MAG: dephospho-CoA kinase [Lachnospiraceae bacterium]|nr:dephospho-CoA kinase [Lachnospiraceae bacterium]